MAIPYLVALDLNKNELLNARLQNLATPPTSPVTGQVYYDTNLGYARIWDGAAWQRVAPKFLSDLGAAQANLDLNTNKLTNVGEPTADSDAATKGYVDGVAQGLDIKESVRAATTANITLSAAQTVDGVAVVAGDRVLVKNQSTASENGIYVVASGAWTRAADFDEDSEVTAGAFTFVEEGTTNADTGWVLSSDGTLTVGTSALDFTKFSTAGAITAGDGLTKTGNTLDVGAGTGIVVNADDVAVAFADTNPADPAQGGAAPGAAVTASRSDHVHGLPTDIAYVNGATLVGDNTTTEFVVTHGLGTQDVVAQVRESASPFAVVYVDTEVISTTQVRFRFALPPLTGTDYRVTILG